MQETVDYRSEISKGVIKKYINAGYIMNNDSIYLKLAISKW